MKTNDINFNDVESDSYITQQKNVQRIIKLCLKVDSQGLAHL